jgi:probable rRNA maturation factor
MKFNVHVQKLKMLKKNKLSLSVQYPDTSLETILTRARLRRWVQSALFAPARITIRLVDAEEGRVLNREYRGKDYATNVLTFAYSEEQDDANEVSADVVLCTDILQNEAAEQGKSLLAHAAHLTIHGILHAQGYDHEDEQEAEEMEAIEIELLAKLRIANPYQP